jgi:hypothetical protein
MPVNLEADATVSKTCCGIAHCAKRQTEHVAVAARLTAAATKNLSRLVAREAAEVEALKEQTLCLATVIEGRAQAILKCVRQFKVIK